MKHQQTTARRIAALGVATLGAALLAACGGGGGGGGSSTDVAASDRNVPASASTSGTAFVQYLTQLKRDDNTSEPLVVPAGFAVPDENQSEPLSLPAPG